MVKLPPEVKETLSKQKPIPLATASKNGVPNVIFVGLVKIVDDETLMVVDNFFNKTAKNLRENPKVAIVCYTPDPKRSYQIKGSVEIIGSGKTHEEMQAWVHGINPKLPAKSAVLIKVEEIYDSVSGPNAGARIA
ncbi:MAG: pyridoxamine 5'-phosphate oxidase family protein [Methanomassiliicoccales archaeon]|jgi:predicted pyridoxine 5'-phosphate oxidase superfamily flavin-nucleotide-binding protein